MKAEWARVAPPVVTEREMERLDLLRQLRGLDEGNLLRSDSLGPLRPQFGPTSSYLRGLLGREFDR